MQLSLALPGITDLTAAGHRRAAMVARTWSSAARLPSSNPPQPKLPHCPRTLPDPFIPSSGDRMAGNREFPGRQPSVPAHMAGIEPRFLLHRPLGRSSSAAELAAGQRSTRLCHAGEGREVAVDRERGQGKKTAVRRGRQG